MISEAQEFGLDVDRIGARHDEGDGIWPWHEQAVHLFNALGTQWRVVAGMEGRSVIGLDYSALPPVMQILGLEPTEMLFDELRVIEAGAVAAMNGER